MPLPNKKNFLRDILPKHENGSFTSPVLTNKVKSKNENEDEIVYQKVADPVIEYNNPGKPWRIWILAVVAILAIGGTLLYVFSSAEVTITPRVDEISINSDFTAKKDSLSTAGDLGFSVLTIEKNGSQNVTADGQKMIDTKASGTITIYNSFSLQPQKLIRNTRFETTDGLIYRIDQSVTVPGFKTVAGKIVPGSVEATVYADLPGVKYNIAPTSFTIPGFKSDLKRWNAFSARSEGPMINGYSGVAGYLSDAKQKLVRAEIRAELEKQILAEAKTSVPVGQFIPTGAYTVVFESLPLDNVSNSQIPVKEKASVLIYTFKISDWDKVMAKSSLFGTEIGSSTVKMVNRDSLNFSWKARPQNDSPGISFHVKGNASFVWDIDAQKIAESLVGVKRNDVKNVLKQYNEIKSADAFLSPFWRTSFPDDPKKIKVTIKE